MVTIMRHFLLPAALSLRHRRRAMMLDRLSTAQPGAPKPIARGAISLHNGGLRLGVGHVLLYLTDTVLARSVPARVGHLVHVRCCFTAAVRLSTFGRELRTAWSVVKHDGLRDRGRIALTARLAGRRRSALRAWRPLGRGAVPRRRSSCSSALEPGPLTLRRQRRYGRFSGISSLCSRYRRCRCG